MTPHGEEHLLGIVVRIRLVSWSGTIEDDGAFASLHIDCLHGCAPSVETRR